MKHKMIGCSEECLRLACCDFCIYVEKEPVVDSIKNIVDFIPCGCKLHKDQEHQDIAEGCDHCSDFHCYRADANNMVVNEVDDETICQ